VSVLGRLSLAMNGFLVVISAVLHLLPSLLFYIHGRRLQLFR
jgi:hypothetical protein